MAKQDPLFTLIKAMTKAEKRQFKVDAAKFQVAGNKDYLRLFDAIDAQKECDEAAIKKKFKDEPYFRQLGSVKLYLHRQIMRSLKNLYDDASSSIKLSNYILEIEILFRKKLFKNCASTVKKAKAYAYKYDSMPHLLKIIEWETRLSDYVFNFYEVNKMKQKGIKESIETTRLLAENNALKQLYFDSLEAWHLGGQVTFSGGISEESTILHHPLMKKKHPSFKNEMMRLIIKAHEALFKRNLEESNKGVKDILQLYEAHPHHIEESVNEYFVNLLALTTALITAKKFKEAEHYLQKMKNIYAKRGDELIGFSIIKMLGLEVYHLLGQGEFLKTLEFLPRLKALIEANAGEKEALGSVGNNFLYYLCFDIYFKNGDFKNAHACIQKLMNANYGTELHMQSAVRIANLILQYEQGEYKQMGYILRSTYRFLLKKQILHSPEVVILDFIRKAMKLTSERQIPIVLAEFKEQLLPYAQGTFVADFGLIEWIDSKLEKRSLSEIIKEKYLAALSLEVGESRS